MNEGKTEMYRQSSTVLASKTYSEWEHPFHNTVELYLLHQPLYFGKQDWDVISFQAKVPDLIKQIMEDRLRHARCPVPNTESVTSMVHFHECECSSDASTLCKKFFV